MVLLDLGLPDLDGCQVCTRVRSQAPGGREMIVIAMTGWGQDADRRRTEAGFDQHLVKPVSIVALRVLMARLVEHRGTS